MQKKIEEGDDTVAKISEIIELMRQIAPEDKTMPSYNDNVGLILGSPSDTVTRVLCCLDATKEVIDEAIEKGAELIISHHPFFRTAPLSITPSDPLGEKILRAAKNGLAIYSAHTNLDIARDGINDYVAELLGLKVSSVMEECGDGLGLGRVGELAASVDLKELAKLVKEAFSDSYVRIIAKESRPVLRVAILNGGGGSNEHIDQAIDLKADCYITADVKYHSALYATERGLAIIEPTHYAMEKVYIKRLVEILKGLAKKSGHGLEFILTESEKSPYFKG